MADAESHGPTETRAKVVWFMRGFSLCAGLAVVIELVSRG